jgi:oligopeptide/dipeptide ABC transporter ATP-binding protein
MLLACHPDRATDLIGIPGTVPAATAQPPGCRFHPRCPISRPNCAVAVPEAVRIFDGSRVACPYHADPLPEVALG